MFRFDAEIGARDRAVVGPGHRVAMEARRQKFARARCQTAGAPLKQHSFVFEYTRDYGTLDKIPTCDLLLRRQTAIACYLQLRSWKWTLSGQKTCCLETSKGSIWI